MIKWTVLAATMLAALSAVPALADGDYENTQLHAAYCLGLLNVAEKHFDRDLVSNLPPNDKLGIQNLRQEAEYSRQRILAYLASTGWGDSPSRHQTLLMLATSRGEQDMELATRGLQLPADLRSRIGECISSLKFLPY